MSGFDEDDLTEKQLRKRGEHFAKGLAILWNEPKKTIVEERDLLTDNRKIKRYTIRKREKSRKEKRTPIRTLWDLCVDEALREVTSFKPPPFTEAHNTKVSETIRKSQLQQHINNKPVFTTAMKRYFRAISILEYEHDHGQLTDSPFDATMVKESVWTPNEKKKFFVALDRCGKYNPEEIARRIGPTKTMAEVHEYIRFLDVASKATTQPFTKKIKHPFAREMSINFIMQEDRLAKQIQHALEVESYEKHLALCATHPEIQKANEFFELWNMSSLTRLFAGQSDLTVLCSTTFNYYQLVKKFVQDIIVDLYTHSLNNTADKTVSRSAVNYIVAKKRKFNDVRFRELDIMSVVGGKNNHGAQRWSAQYGRNRSISFLAKRRRLGRDTDEVDDESPLMVDDEDEEEDDGVIVLDDDDDVDEEEEEEEEDDPMFEDIDDEDELRGQYAVEDFDSEHEAAVEDYMNNTITAQEDVSYDDESIDPHAWDECIKEEDELEEEMEELDALDEEQLSEYLGFYNTQQIADAHLIGTPTEFKIKVESP